MGTVEPESKRTERVTSLLDKPTYRAFAKLVRRERSTESTVVYRLIQNALQAERKAS